MEKTMNALITEYCENQIFTQLKIEDMPKSPVEFFNCQFNNCNFERMNFSDYVFDRCIFNGSNLALANVTNAKLMNVVFNDCKVEGVRFDQCDPFILEVYFDRCLLRNCSFSDLNMKKCKFENSQILESDFYKTKLMEASFQGSVLSRTVFAECDLTKADFQEATDFIIDPTINRLKKAVFSSNELAGLLRHLDLVIK